MINRDFKKSGLIFIISVLLSAVLSFGAFASPLDEEGESVPESVSETEAVLTTSENEDNTEASEKQEETTEKESEASTDVSTTKKNDTHTTTEKRNDTANDNRPAAPNGNNNNDDDDDDDDSYYVWNGDDEADAGDGEDEDEIFTVYIELNNGEERLRYDLKEESVVPEPTAKPTRKGFKFAGWFADAEFKTAWNFKTDIAKKGTVIYVKWESDGSAVLHKITVAPTVGGTVEVNPKEAVKGERINITVVPDEGKRLKEGSILINGVKSELLSFEMLEGDMTVSAEFEDIPQKTEGKSDNKLVIILAAAVAAVAIAIAVVVAVSKRKSADPQEDEDWLDESITVEDGFKDGKVVKEIDEDEMFTIDESNFDSSDDE